MRRLCGALFAAWIGVVAVPASGVAASVGSAATQVVTTAPVDANGHLLPGYRVVKHIPGAKCTPRSVVTGNAYKCVSHFTYDPCWLSGNRAYVDCITSPYSRRITRLHVTRGYHNRGGLGAAKKLPWGLQLTNGVKTTLIPGDFGDVHGLKIHYSYNNFKVVLVGNPDKSGSLWRIQKAKDVGGFHYKVVGWVTISKAWYGAPTHLG
ncbi:MAG TPA: hypothetical protein VHC43_13290 [Mycobacteriales bacterium]|nr:hypothetical protein [Mycobacteriales bacterium]